MKKIPPLMPSVPCPMDAVLQALIENGESIELTVVYAPQRVANLDMVLRDMDLSRL